MDELHPAPLRLERQPAGGWGQGHARDERHLEHLEQRPRVPDPAGRLAAAPADRELGRALRLVRFCELAHVPALCAVLLARAGAGAARRP